jgi:hypothetical protein
MRDEAVKVGDSDRTQGWPGQSAAMASAAPAAAVVSRIWSQAEEVLS